ncbi:MAG: TonB-dependent receptor [Bacteroidia bacterium]|nr:TonB-dependent receptor [Bacteroidia bacterium]
MRLFLITLITLAGVNSFSQPILDQKAEGAEKGKRVSAFLEEFEKTHPVRFYFLEAWIEDIAFEENFEDQALRQVLDELFRGTELNYILLNESDIVIVKDPRQAIQRKNLINIAQRERKKIDRMLLGNSTSAKRNEMFVVRGQILDSKTMEPLVGSTIQVSDISVVTITNAEGKYELRVPAGEHIVNVSYVNYEERVIELGAYESGEINVSLEEMPTLLDEIVIQDKEAREIATSNIGLTQLSMKEIKKAPSFLGEVDLIKQIQNLPGVTTAGEAASGFNVRGGSVDQNLVLYDGMPVFNSSHVFGFFSTFNAEAVRDVLFYRGGIPAEFGGRVSSVLEINSKEGDYEKWKGSGGVGMLSSNLMLNGPLVKDKTSLALSLRANYSDWLIHAVRTNYVDLRNSSVFFYDGTAKLSHKFSNNTKLTFSGYSSHDQFRLAGDSSYRWGNLLGSLRLDHSISSRLTSTFIVGYGSYDYEVLDTDPKTGFSLTYKITYPSVKADFHYQSGSHKLSYGIQSVYYGFNPGTLVPSSPESNVKYIEMGKQQSIETGIYAGDGYTINDNFFVEGGLRFSLFSALGPGSVNVYKSELPIESVNLIDTLNFSSGERIKSYNGIEPRLSFRYNISPSSSIKLGYNRMNQYLHLITNTTAITPVDIWQPSGYYFKPQFADQLSIGYFQNFKEKTYEAFAEVFYKKFTNILDFKDGAQLLLNPQLETDLLQGTGRAYGVETSIAKNNGRLTGSINYTYSRSLRTINGATEEESVNKGEEYPSNFDQPNILNVNWKYAISRRYFFTGNFTFRTGRPITSPLSGFSIDNITVANFSERNQYRIPDYHRLDIAFVMEGNHKRKKFWDGTWTLSIYNVYARRNPYTIFFKDNGNGILRPYQLSVVGTVLPSLTYSFRF